MSYPDSLSRRSRRQNRLQNAPEWGFGMDPFAGQMSLFDQMLPMESMMQQHMSMFPPMGLMFNDPFFQHSDSMFFGSNGNSLGNLDVQDKGDHYKLSLEIQNLDKSTLEFHVDPHSRQVSISGSITQTIRQNGFTSQSSELFSRLFPLPAPDAEEVIDDVNASANYKNGLLVIKIPKKKLNRLGYEPRDKDGDDEDYEIISETPKIQEI